MELPVTLPYFSMTLTEISLGKLAGSTPVYMLWCHLVILKNKRLLLFKKSTALQII
jgi:hypothetical protein